MTMRSQYLSVAIFLAAWSVTLYADDPFHDIQKLDLVLDGTDEGAPRPPGAGFTARGVYFQSSANWAYSYSFTPNANSGNNWEHKVTCYHFDPGALWGIIFPRRWRSNNCTDDQDRFITAFHKEGPPNPALHWKSDSVVTIKITAPYARQQVLNIEFDDGNGGKSSARVTATQ